MYLCDIWEIRIVKAKDIKLITRRELIPINFDIEKITAIHSIWYAYRPYEIFPK